MVGAYETEVAWVGVVEETFLFVFWRFGDDFLGLFRDFGGDAIVAFGHAGWLGSCVIVEVK